MAVKTNLDLVNYLHQMGIFPVAKRELEDLIPQFKAAYAFLRHNYVGETVEMSLETLCQQIGIGDIASTEAKIVRTWLNHLVDLEVLDSKKSGATIIYSNNIARDTSKPVVAVMNRSNDKVISKNMFYLQSPRDDDRCLAEGLGNKIENNLIQPLEGRKLFLVTYKDGIVSVSSGSSKADTKLYRAWLSAKDVFSITDFSFLKNGNFYKVLDVDYSTYPDAKRVWDKRYDTNRMPLDWEHIAEEFFVTSDTVTRIRCIKEIDPENPNFWAKAVKRAPQTQVKLQAPVAVKPVVTTTVVADNKNKIEEDNNMGNKINENKVNENKINENKINVVNVYLQSKGMTAHAKLVAIKAVYFGNEEDSNEDIALLEAIKGVAELTALPPSARDTAIKSLVENIK